MKQAKETNIYCTIPNPCTNKDRQASLKKYLCCHFCNSKTCESRCKHSLEDCKKDLVDKEFVEQNLLYINKTPVLKAVVKEQKKEEKVIQNDISNLSTKALAERLKVDYSKVYYLVKFKHLTNEEIFNLLSK